MPLVGHLIRHVVQVVRLNPEDAHGECFLEFEELLVLLLLPSPWVWRLAILGIRGYSLLACNGIITASLLMLVKNLPEPLEFTNESLGWSLCIPGAHRLVPKWLLGAVIRLRAQFRSQVS